MVFIEKYRDDLGDFDFNNATLEERRLCFSMLMDKTISDGSCFPKSGKKSFKQSILQPLVDDFESYIKNDISLSHINKIMRETFGFTVTKNDILILFKNNNKNEAYEFYKQKITASKRSPKDSSTE